MLEYDDNYCGVVITYHDDAKTILKEEYFTNAGKKEGIYKSFWENGQLFKEVNYIAGQRGNLFYKFSR